MNSREPIVLVSLFVSVLLPVIFIWVGKDGEAKARARRMAEHRLGARLLRFNI